MEELNLITEMAHELDELGLYRTASVLDNTATTLCKEAASERELVRRVSETSEEVKKLQAEIKDIQDTLSQHGEDSEEYNSARQRLMMWPKIIEMLEGRTKLLQKMIKKRQGQGIPYGVDPAEIRRR